MRSDLRGRERIVRLGAFAPYLAPRGLMDSGEGERCRMLGVGSLVGLVASLALFAA